MARSEQPKLFFGSSSPPEPSSPHTLLTKETSPQEETLPQEETSLTSPNPWPFPSAVLPLPLSEDPSFYPLSTHQSSPGTFPSHSSIHPPQSQSFSTLPDTSAEIVSPPSEYFVGTNATQALKWLRLHMPLNCQILNFGITASKTIADE